MATDLIDIVPKGPDGDGITIIIERAYYDTWLAERGPALAAEGYTRLVVADHVSYEARQWSAR